MIIAVLTGLKYGPGGIGKVGEKLLWQRRAGLFRLFYVKNPVDTQISDMVVVFRIPCYEIIIPLLDMTA